MGAAKKRLFIAVDVTSETKLRLAEAQARLRGVPAIKWVEPAGMHLTFIFLGYVDEAGEKAVKKAMRRVAKRSAPFRFNVAGIGAFPSSKRPRVIWAGAGDEGQAAALAADLAAELTRLGYEPETRPFRGHITLGRVKEPKRLEAEAIFARAASALGSNDNMASELVLYRSRLSRTGAEYEAEATFPLGRTLAY